MAEKKPTAKVKSGVIKTPETVKAPEAPAKAKKAEPEKKAAAAAVTPAAAKTEEKKEAKAMEEKKTTAAAKTTAKKPAAKAPAKKAAAPKKAELKAEVILQFNGNDYTEERLVQSAKDVWQYDMGRDVNDIKSVKIYAKPDEKKAYVLVNETEQLSFDI
ncbi:MAG: DUF6465 family protein [Lachnospiraceae bacterium]|jgi:hypothetical protein|nr:DUF6465 family protein [Lachnospiraceae bacterium]MCI1397798.1 DUF6465 family protein [Lachnospiraceae bacterium]MCI1423012.1 DUF6465 family protein [Lachnospiraceae bacterium]MCI1451774.1 DUF6465 family protein [Lachnospiraceae bacterium]